MSGAGQDGAGVSGGGGRPPKRRKWLPHEDEELCRQVKLHGKNWPAVAEHMENRDASGCRKRFVNYLEQVLYKGEWTPEEDAALLRAYAIHGNHWSQIAKEGILNRRSARALGWRWAKVFARKVSAVETHSRRHHPYKPTPAVAAAAAAAAAAAPVTPLPSVEQIPGPKVLERAEAVPQPHPAFAAVGAAAAASPIHQHHQHQAPIPAHAQSEIISLLLKLETQKIFRALSLLLSLTRQESEQQRQPNPNAPEVFPQAPPPPMFFPQTTWEAETIEARLPIESDDCTIRLLGDEDLYHF